MGLKRVLIISPYFPPSNAADMQRIRMSLPYFGNYGLEAEVVTVDPKFSDMVKDDLLLESVPPNILVHLIPALPKKYTAKFGLGSIALRSMWFYLRKVNALLKQNKYHLIYFSTTQFPVCVLGAYWKKRFKIPYIIDMQDPWHSDYYRDKPKEQRPPKYWFSYRLNKLLEPIAMKEVGGLISVSQAYIDDLKKRYPTIRNIPSSVITFGVFEKDFEIAAKYAETLKTPVKPESGKINLVYIGRGGPDMHQAIKLLFSTMLKGLLTEPELFKKFRFYFIGTSYAPAGKGCKSIQPMADEMGLQEYVLELTDRIGFYESLATLQKADILFITGSDDPKYTASKLYPYLMTKKALLAIFHEKSTGVTVLKSCMPDAKVFTFPGDEKEIISNIYRQLAKWSAGPIDPLIINKEAFKEFDAPAMTAKQTKLFDQVIANAE